MNTLGLSLMEVGIIQQKTNGGEVTLVVLEDFKSKFCEAVQKFE